MDYKVYTVNFNGVLNSVIELLKESGHYTENYHDADLFLLWQDVRGELRELANIAKYSLKKPAFVLQHGRGATRDYCFPNKFELIADKMLVWGELEKRRLLKDGLSEDKIEVVGCPLLPILKQKNKEREGKNVLFVPVIAEKEEPENFIVYQYLRIWEAEKSIKRINRDFGKFKKAWAWEENIMRTVTLPDGTKEDRLWNKDIKRNLPRWLTYADGLINVKLTGIHDMAQYQSPLIITNPGDLRFNDVMSELLANIDVMVCLEEGTMPLLACALDIPVICVDGFKYESYGGCENYDQVEKIKTNACYWISDAEKVGKTIDHALNNPLELRKNRIRICEEEAGAHLGNANENIVKFIERYMQSKRQEQGRESVAV